MASFASLNLPAGVITGDHVVELFKFCKDNEIALPAFNVTSSSTVNAILEAAKAINSPVIIQVSNGGAAFFAGKGLGNAGQAGSIAGSTAAALHTRAMAAHYGVPVVMHSDHCAKKLLPWFDGMLEADEAYFKAHGEPLFSSHMLDLSEEFDGENIETCVSYLRRMAPMKLFLEMEIGITGGEEDGVDNSDADLSKLYTQPEQVWQVHKTLSAVAPHFSIAAAFGNVHGVYKPGNVKLSPELLVGHQKFIQEQLGCEEGKPTFLVMHGGSGSTAGEIGLAVSSGVVKMNIDTDTQWAYWNGVREHEAEFRGYLQGQIGNPDGADKPNKKKYDPRVWVRKAEQSMIKRAHEAFKALNCENVLGR